jgi:hypothetical protein
MNGLKQGIKAKSALSYIIYLYSLVKVGQKYFYFEGDYGNTYFSC